MKSTLIRMSFVAISLSLGACSQHETSDEALKAEKLKWHPDTANPIVSIPGTDDFVLGDMWGAVSVKHPRGEVCLWKSPPIEYGKTFSWVSGIAVSADGKLCAASRSDGHVRLWETDTWRLRCSAEFGGWYGCLCFSNDGKSLFLRTFDGDGVLRVAAADLREIARYPAGNFQKHDFPKYACSPTAPVMVVAHTKGELWTRRLDDGVSKPLIQLGSAVLNLALSLDGEFAAVADYDEVKVISVNRAEVVAKCKTGMPINAMAFSLDGKFLVTAEATTTKTPTDVILRSAKTAAPVAQITYPRPFMDITFSGDGRTIVGSSLDDKLVTWKLPLPLAPIADLPVDN